MRTLSVLERDRWTVRADAHRERARQWTDPHLRRRGLGRAHPVEDFLWEYYDLSPGRLELWHPGLGFALADAEEYAERSGYRRVDHRGTGDLVAVDARRLARRERGLRWTRELLVRTADATPRWGCFGLHEWAMVFGSDRRRHVDLPLRLGRDGTDEVVRSHRIGCTHVDAFRFFTDAAKPRNEAQLTRADQLDMEQPACLHVSMDLYRIAYRLLPFIEATIVLDAFELALDVRRVDMRASPYDVTDVGLAPIAIETQEGKSAYVRHQRVFADRARPLRGQLLDLVDGLLAQLDT